MLCLFSASHLRASQDAGSLAIWNDKEVRRTYSREKNETAAFFALLPSCAMGSPTVTFVATYRGKDPISAPGHVDVRADLGIHISPNFIRTSTLKFLLDRGIKNGATIDLSQAIRPALFPAPGEALDTASATMDLVDFIQLLRANRAAMNIFGLDCAISGTQMDALRAFAQSILPPVR